MICGNDLSSSIALPSAMRSGQNETSIVRFATARSFSTIAVTPG